MRAQRAPDHHRDGLKTNYAQMTGSIWNQAYPHKPVHLEDLRRNNHTAPPVATITTISHTSQP